MGRETDRMSLLQVSTNAGPCAADGAVAAPDLCDLRAEGLGPLAEPAWLQHLLLPVLAGGLVRWGLQRVRPVRDNGTCSPPAGNHT